jgi:hypothetical protein
MVQYSLPLLIILKFDFHDAIEGRYFLDGSSAIQLLIATRSKNHALHTYPCVFNDFYPD